MKIEISLEQVDFKGCIRPRASVRIDITEGELAVLEEKNKEVFAAIAALLRMAVQHVQ